MGGEHKCPVCQATFTRPQHVARHMRSHTGDRPYKCQYCGDQFARSDLLARHINKCHANEKPLPNTTPGSRRKGSAATSRATTSKQACDQCVQSSLPCDGANPCSKCVSRRCRCTYVKFHRQTAPTGPGHHPPRSPSSSSSSLNGNTGASRLPSHLDDFILAPPPSAPPVTSFPSSDQIFHTPFTFHPAAPAYPQNWTTADMSQAPFSMTPDTDLAAKYRAQVELLRRPGPSILPNNAPTMFPAAYLAQQHPTPSSSWYPAWGESGAYPTLDDTKPFEHIARTHSLASSEPTPFPPEFYGAGLIGSAYRPRRASLEFSDSSSATSQSVPSSAASSSVQLPLSNEMYDTRPEEIQTQTHNAHILQHQRRGSMPTSQPPPFPGSVESSQPPPTQQSPHVAEGGFSSAFGLMSIDDPSVLAGLSSDGVPFFSHLGVGVLPHSPNSTPMPTRMHHAHSHQGRDRGVSLSALPTPRLAKDATETRDLKDVWKAYMRSPLSGSGTTTLDLSSPLPQMPQSPSGQRRRMRVSSLPSVTPTAEKGQPMAMNGHGETGTLRTTVHGNPDDLRSYEAAVNARNPSLKLNLVPRRRGTRPNLNGSPRMEGTGVVGASPAATGQTEHQRISRPSSSSSTSSLAQAFTMPTPQQHGHQHQHQHHPSHVHAHAPVSGVVKPPPMQGASISLPIPPSMSTTGLHSHSIAFASSTSLTFEPGSRASSVTSDGTGTGGSGSDGEVFRPSFKRYPSQTLGPANSKRAMVERLGGELKGVKVLQAERREDGDGMEDLSTGGEGFERVGVCAGSRPIAGLPERAKRG